MDESGDIPRRQPRYPHPRNVYRTAWRTWYVMFRRKGEVDYLGTYETVEEAIEARDAYLQREEAISPAEAG